MLVTVLCFNWVDEAKRAAALLGLQHDTLGAESETLLHPSLDDVTHGNTDVE
jgi:hypothetical protein